MGILKTSFYLGLLFLFIGCHKRKLHLPLQDYLGNQLRIDGYYYSPSIENSDIIDATYFLYRNGIIINGKGFNEIDRIGWEQSWVNGNKLESISRYKYYYGVFIIEGSNIKIESWTNINIPETYVVEGNILNDSTFHITSNYRLSKSGKKRGLTELDEIYHFKQFSPKPDSTNSFIP